MDFREMATDGGNLIRGYGPGEIRVNEDRFVEPLVLFKETFWQGWLPTRAGELEARHLQPLADSGMEVVLLGTGDRLEFPDPRITAPLIDAGVGCETMDTPAACRTYNLLMGEDRMVAAVLFPPEERG